MRKEPFQLPPDKPELVSFGEIPFYMRKGFRTYVAEEGKNADERGDRAAQLFFLWAAVVTFSLRQEVGDPSLGVFIEGHNDVRKSILPIREVTEKLIHNVADEWSKRFPDSHSAEIVKTADFAAPISIHGQLLYEIYSRYRHAVDNQEEISL